MRLPPWMLFAAFLSSCGGGDHGVANPDPETPAPAAIQATSTISLSGVPGQAVSPKPAVRVTSSTGSGVQGVSVTFAVTAGGGSVTGAAQTTDANGAATVGSWTLGASGGTNTLVATITTAGGPVSVTFSANAIISFSITPAIAVAAPGANVAFTATNATVVYKVNDVAGGSAAAGTISATGVYTGPASVPAGDSVIVTAELPDGSVKQTAIVYFLPNLVNKDYVVTFPRVIDAANAKPTRIIVVPAAGVTAVNFVTPAGSASPFTSAGNGAFLFTLDAATALSGYQTGTLHNFVGRLDYRDAAGVQTKLTNYTVNVRDATMPAVAITPLAADAQRSAYVLNIRLDTITVYPVASIVSRALQLLGGDLFDFVAVLSTALTNNNRVYIGVRNDIRGIGATQFNNSAAWGGTGKLRGAIAFPIDGFFDGAEQGFMHEVGHSWINYATDAVLGPGSPHWPPSTMAGGTMGFNIPGSPVGGNFPFTLTSLGNGTVRINRVTQSDLFTPLDLYVMGLLPQDQVPPMYVLPASLNVNTIADGQISPATTYTIGDYIAAHGARIPASDVAPKQFSTAVVVLSYGRLLTAAEMAFFNEAARRAETTVPLTSSSGLSVVTASGFFTATGGRATMRTLLP